MEMHCWSWGCTAGSAVLLQWVALKQTCLRDASARLGLNKPEQRRLNVMKYKVLSCLGWVSAGDLQLVRCLGFITGLRQGWQ